MADEGGPMNGDGGVNVSAGNVALLSDPVDVIIDKLLRYESSWHKKNDAVIRTTRTPPWQPSLFSIES